jgi:hypothetical protein
VVPVSTAVIEVVPVTKRGREMEDADEVAAIEPPVKRRLPSIGGERRDSIQILCSFEQKGRKDVLCHDKIITSECKHNFSILLVCDYQ